ncbi:hypothetical protein DY000_02037759 [Brassica cretica]|uniref:Uncharacterized protein n=2 Tax=Brassica TaxID=3705 RepID=A0ABQ7BF61_BRACR|nr:hypothetical protein DY000_02037759 [Brassica cretica]
MRDREFLTVAWCRSRRRQKGDGSSVPLRKLRTQPLTLSFPPLPASGCRPGIHCSVSAGETTKRSVENVFDISWGCEIDSVENATSLQRWLSDSCLPPQKRAIDRVDIGERGVVASQNLRKGEKLRYRDNNLYQQ